MKQKFVEKFLPYIYIFPITVLSLLVIYCSFTDWDGMRRTMNFIGWSIDFTNTSGKPVRYIHIRVHSAYSASQNSWTNNGFASAVKIEVR